MKERNMMPFLGGVEMSMSCEFNLEILTKKVLISCDRELARLNIEKYWPIEYS